MHTILHFVYIYLHIAYIFCFRYHLKCIFCILCIYSYIHHLEPPYLEISWYIPGISQGYDHVCPNPGIYQVYTCHMTTIFISQVYAWYIPVPRFFQFQEDDWDIPRISFPSLHFLSLVYTWYIPGLCHDACRFEILQLESVLQQNRCWDAAAHKFWFARVFNVHHSTRRPYRAPVGAGLDPRAWGRLD